VREAVRAGHRLVTLTGPGGMGKTRLAVEYARGEGHHAAWFFDLSDATTLDDLLGTLATGLSIELGDVPTDRVGHALRALGKAIVVLDNLEQVLDAARVAVERFLQLAPELVLVCTSRAPLKLVAEHRIPVGPMAVDDAVALFRARAPRVLHEPELPAVRALVAALDGMPLAVELVAARAGTFPLAELRRHLGRHLEAPDDDQRPARHRSVDASLAWSWEVLPEWGRRALAQLSVFEGGFTARAVSAALDPGELAGRVPIDALELLTEAGLLRYEADARRFGLPTIVCAFARARLSPAERDRAWRRHGQVYATLGERDVLALLRGPQGTARYARLLADVDNLAAAVRRARALAEPEVAAKAVRALSAVLLRRGPLTSLGTALDDALATAGLGEADRDDLELLRARCLDAMGQSGAARPVAEGALRRIRTRGASAARSRAESEALQVVAELHQSALEHSVAEIAARAALQLAQQVGDPILEAEASLLVATSIDQGTRWEEARGWFEGALAAFQRAGVGPRRGPRAGGAGARRAHVWPVRCGASHVSPRVGRVSGRR
jgi:predicted ATPase